jgi:hypothetical protein
LYNLFSEAWEGVQVPLLNDPEILARYKHALANWRVTGYVEPIGLANEWLRREVDNITRDGFLQLLHDHVFQGQGEIDQVPETRERWRDQWGYHYDLRPVINGVKLYVETRLVPESLASRDEPMIYIVNIHRA